MLKKGEIPPRHLTVYRLTCATPREALKDFATLDEYAIDPQTGVRGVLYLRAPSMNRPPWLDFVESGTLTALPRFVNASTSAVLFVEIPGQLYVYCFGHGHAFIDSAVIEPDFGLRVALNAIDPNLLRGIDSRTLLEEMTVQTRRQVTPSSSIPAFGLDIASDLLRGVTGASREEMLGARVTGHDALVIDAPVTFDDLGALTRTLERLRQSRKYRREFGWVDQIRLVRDETLHAELDAKLVEMLRSGETEGIQLVPPGIVDYSDVKGFSFDATPEDVRAELTLADYLATLRRDRATLSLQMLRRHRISMRTDDDTEQAASWSVYQALTGEVRLHGAVQVLSEGNWYTVARPLNAAIDAFIREFEKNSIDLPPAHEKEKERTYNKRVSLRRHWTLGDCVPITPTGARTPIEFCDLMTPHRQMIHVKPYAASSTLSHLFAQGATSAEVFLYDPLFRDQVRTKLSPSPRFRSRIPHRSPKARLFEVAFAIIGAKAANWPRSLPFFSKLNFRNVSQRLQRLGYRVSLNYVQREGAASASRGGRRSRRGMPRTPRRVTHAHARP